ncbi:MAG: excinuclease ABC subunit C, partial [Clostridia bacterium]|nr:excinuclease ABC subunit C [Clostridia bacterium]
GKSRPCLNYSIGQCSAPCAGKIGKAAYNENVQRALEFITDGSDSMTEKLTALMYEAAENEEYEKAAKLRDTIKAIGRISEKQKVVAAPVKEQDVFALVGAKQGLNPKACLSVLRFEDYRLYDSEYFIIDLPENLPEARHELLMRYYTMRDNVPPRISIDGEVDSEEVLCEWLSSKADRKVSVNIPQRGEQLRLLDMCRSNSAQKLALYLGRTGKATAALDELGKLLGLKAPPEFIESYDISHTAGSNNVAGMVVFKDGLPYRKSYRRFSIKGFSGQDDYASMAEVIDRRLTEYENNKDTGEGFGRLPDLILLDGGKGQVNAVIPVLIKHNLSIPLFGMVKDSHHRTRAIAMSGGEISLTSKRSAFTLVSTIQEEVHRYSVAYHHAKSKKAGISTTLTRIDGIGETRAKTLMKHFKTIKAISEASEEEIASVKGIGKAAAKTVYDAFHSETEE